MVDIIMERRDGMTDMDALKRELEASGAAEKLLKAADSAEGRKVLSGLDTAAVEKAAKNGDMQALRGILSGVLGTPEGQALAKKIRQSMGK